MKLSIHGRELYGELNGKRKLDGIQRLNKLLVENLHLANRSNQYTVFARSEIEVPKAPNVRKFISVQRVLKRLQNGDQIGANIECLLSGPQISYSLCEHLPTLKNVFKVGIIYDLVPITHPEILNSELERYDHPESAARRIFDHIVHQSDLIHCISRDTQKQIVEHFKVPEEKTFVAYGAFRSFSSTASQLVRPYQRDYILTVSRLDPRKNLDVLIRAFAQLASDASFANVDLLIIGRDGWRYMDVKQLVQDLKLEHRVKFLGFVDDETLPSYYAHSACYVCPSLTEGFGLPVVEAMAQGAVVISSNGGALPEIIDRKDFLFSPRLVDQLVDRLRWVFSNQFDRIEAKQYMHDRVRSFTPERMMQQWSEGIEQGYAQWLKGK